MGGFDKLFGLGLFLGGIVIAAYYTLWMVSILPCVSKKFEIPNIFLPAEMLFTLPAAALVGGVSFIMYFIDSTNKKIAAKKAAEAAQKKNQ